MKATAQMAGFVAVAFVVSVAVEIYGISIIETGWANWIVLAGPCVVIPLIVGALSPFESRKPSRGILLAFTTAGAAGITLATSFLISLPRWDPDRQFWFVTILVLSVPAIGVAYMCIRLSQKLTERFQTEQSIGGTPHPIETVFFLFAAAGLLVIGCSSSWVSVASGQPKVVLGTQTGFEGSRVAWILVGAALSEVVMGVLVVVRRESSRALRGLTLGCGILALLSGSITILLPQVHYRGPTANTALAVQLGPFLVLLGGLIATYAGVSMNPISTRGPTD